MIGTIILASLLEVFPGVTAELKYAETNDWKVTAELVDEAPSVRTMIITSTRASDAVPPTFEVEVNSSLVDTSYLWHPGIVHPMLPMAEDFWTSLPSWMPIFTFFSENNENRLTMATDIVKEPVHFYHRTNEEESGLRVVWTFFKFPELPTSKTVVRIRFDARRQFWSKAIEEGSAWMSKASGCTPLSVPDVARDPVYSSWYSFHQNLKDTDLEAECAIAAKLGMKTLIVDDGWQTDDNQRGYAFTGDWEVSKRRFPDMKKHVENIHKLGMKYMLWYSVPFMGDFAKNRDQFADKFLFYRARSKCSVLDPRFPEVREYLISVYERAMKEWNVDGFKLDFIDTWGEPHPGLADAVDLLMNEITRRLKAINPNVLIEFRQGYMGTAIRQYGNMMRVADCPCDYSVNRIGIVNLRLTSGDMAVHSDMLEWHPNDSVENAARYVLNTVFSTIQYSMMLRTLPPEHMQMITFWLNFTREHQRTLQHGRFLPYYPQQNYPLIVADGDDEQIVGLYAPLLVDVPLSKPCYVLNATSKAKVLLRLPSKCVVETFDALGQSKGAKEIDAGLVELDCPVSGFIKTQPL